MLLSVPAETDDDPVAADDVAIVTFSKPGIDDS